MGRADGRQQSACGAEQHHRTDADAARQRRGLYGEQHERDARFGSSWKCLRRNLSRCFRSAGADNSSRRCRDLFGRAGGRDVWNSFNHPVELRVNGRPYLLAGEELRHCLWNRDGAEVVLQSGSADIGVRACQLDVWNLARRTTGSGSLCSTMQRDKAKKVLFCMKSCI